MKRYQFAIALLLSLSVLAFSQPPEPPTGKRWILNEKFSDEFNGTELDLTKWYDYHPTWKGREPGLFMPSQVKVKNGYMTIRGEKMDKDTVIINWDGSKSTYNIKAGAVVSRSLDAYFGYYECKFKAAKTTMSTTFWLSSRAGNYAGPEACNDRYSLEWDVQECIGREGNFDGSWFAKGMHSNAHFWYTDCAGEKHDYRAQDVRFESDKLASDTFSIYGGWWKNERRATYYYNGEVKSQKFYTGVKEQPFDHPMGVNLVSETYPFPWIALPTDEELADSSKNICYYDWVRAYTLVDVDKPVDRENSLLENGGFESGDFAYWSGWGGNPREVVSDQAYSGTYAAHIVGPGAPEYVVNLRAFSTYELSCYGKIAGGSAPIFFGIKDPSENVLGSVQVTETSWTRKSFRFTTGSSGGQLKFYFYASNAGDEGYADQFELVPVSPDEDPPEETVMFDEELTVLDTIREKTTRQTLDFQLSYMANADREINFRLFNRDKVLVGEQKYLALAGYGKKEFILPLDSIPAAANDYQLIADIRPIDSTLVDTFQTAEFTFDLLDPADVDLQVLDLRDDSPIEAALVTIGDSVKSTDEFGRINFHGLPVGLLSIQIDKEGYLNYLSGDYTLRKDTSFTVRLTPVSHSLILYILNSHTGLPLAKTNISIDGTTVQSDYSGRASFLIYSGVYLAQVRHERYADKDLSIAFDRDTTLYVEMDQILADVKFVLKMDNLSLAGATVTLDDRSELTSTIGMANFQDLKTDSTYLYRIENQSEFLMEDSVVFLTDTTLRVYLTTGVSTTFSGAEDLRLYPNPANDFIRIFGLESNCDYEIRDVQGRIMDSGILINEERVDVSELAPGIFFLKPGDHPLMKFSINK